MKIYIFLFLFISFFVFAEESLTIKEQNTYSLCVQTLNTYGVFYAGNLTERHRQTLHFLRDNACDINLLQEVVDKDHYDNLSKLSSELNMTSVYFGRADDNKNSGLVGVFKGSLVNVDIEYFPVVQNEVFNFVYQSFQSVDKGFGVVQFHHPQLHKNTLLVLNLHLDHISQQTRVRQILFILERILHQPDWWDTLLIVGGDLNFSPESLEFNMMEHLLRLKDPYEEINKERFCTHWCEDSSYDILNTLFGGQVRDYILFKPSSRMSIHPVDIDVFPKKYNGINLSDHYGVRAVFNFESISDSRENENNLLEEKVADFKRVLKNVKLVLGDDGDSTEVQFVQSLEQGVEQLHSHVMQYLRLN